MPKGDRLKLKADPDDGTTPIANLLLEAVAMAKISGLQKGAIIYLWRETYGWLVDGKRLKQKKIGLAEWSRALDRDKSRVAKALSELQEKNIINRHSPDHWGGYIYSLNTDISTWNSDSINISKLSELVIVASFATVDDNTTVDENATVDNIVTVGGNDHSSHKHDATVDENATPQLTKTPLPSYIKRNIKESINKGGDVSEKPTNKNLSSIIKGITDKSPYGEGLKQVFSGIDKLRGYKPPKRSAEAKSIRKMLISGYTPEQILKTWETLKRDNFWKDKELYMMSVETQIGAVLKSVRPKRSKHGDGW